MKKDEIYKNWLILISGPILVMPLYLVGFLEGMQNIGFQKVDWIIDEIINWLCAGLWIGLFLVLLKVSIDAGWWRWQQAPDNVQQESISAKKSWHRSFIITFVVFLCVLGLECMFIGWDSKILVALFATLMATLLFLKFVIEPTRVNLTINSYPPRPSVVDLLNVTEENEIRKSPDSVELQTQENATSAGEQSNIVIKLPNEDEIANSVKPE
jgi:hypothetical protein